MGFNMAIEGSGSDGDESGSPFSDTDSVDEDYDDATEFDSSQFVACRDPKITF